MKSPRESTLATGFALPDLLVVVAVCALLAMLPLHAFSSGNAGAKAAGCLAGLKRLQYAWDCYAADNQGWLATALPDRLADAWVDDTGEASAGQPPPYLDPNIYRDPKRAKFAPYLPDAQIYHCPADYSTARYRNTNWMRIRSRSMNQAFGTGGIWLSPGNEVTKRYRTYMRLGDLGEPSPGSLFVLIDEHPASINDGAFANAMFEQPAATRIIDYPASYHDGGGGLSFADGHAEIHHWVDRRTKPVVKTGQLALNVPSPNNQDMAWLSARTSARTR